MVQQMPLCCRLLNPRPGSLTLNNLEVIMCGEEERSTPSMHSVFSPTQVRTPEGVFKALTL